MGLSKWDPFKDFIFLQEKMSRIFDEAFMQYKGSSGLSGGAWYPPVDIYETGEKIVLKAEVPGVEMKDISIEIDENVITLRGERRLKRKLGDQSCHRLERFYGTFQRVFSLPNEVEKGDVKASLAGGVLEIQIRKALEKKQKSVKITVE